MVMVLTRRAAKCAEDSYIGASSLRASASLRETFIPQTLADDNYLQIADNSGNRYLWDPSEPIATRPLVWLHGGNTYSYTHDGNKNVSELIDDNGAVTAHYEYAPFGDVTAAVGNLASANRFRFSSEYADDTLGLVYYNYRHYEPVTGRWMGRDLVSVEQASRFSDNSPNCFMDLLGAMPLAISGAAAMHDQIVHGKNDNGTFDGIAKAASRNNWVAVKSGRDIITHLKQLSQDDCCVDHYTIAGHGWRTTTKDDPKRIYVNALPGAFGGDSDNNNQGIYKDNTVISDDELNRENGGVYLSDLEAEISAGNILFCPSCQIQIYACRIGSGFTIELSRITGCSVVAASGSCSIDDGKWKSGPGGFHERQLNEFFGFYRVKYLREGMDPKIDWIGNTYVPF